MTLTPEKIEVAKNVLAMGKAIAPDRFPALSAESARAWALVLGDIAVPADVWDEAVSWWALNGVGDRMATPRELKDAAYHVVKNVWEVDPEKKVELERSRREIIRQKAARGLLPLSAVPPVGDDPQLAIEPRSDSTASHWREVRAGIAQRARDRRIAEREAAGRGELFEDMNKQPGEIPENGS
ncbi:hypothetical protein [Corynebacterium sp.]|uniref:hypothetical protein n=1 Tax=Corynebacterium sp. TaxID=1720 RepID=UPI0025C3307F|nr:hypothetical protein [Corynebacterium sp.]